MQQTININYLKYLQEYRFTSIFLMEISEECLGMLYFNTSPEPTSCEKLKAHYEVQCFRIKIGRQTGSDRKILRVLL